MKPRLAFMLVPILLCGCATIPLHEDTRDVEVIGRLKNLSYQSTNDPDDLLGHGFITARLTVDRIISGRMSSKQVKVTYFAHTYLIDNHKFHFKIRRTSDGDYVICANKGGIGIKCES